MVFNGAGQFLANVNVMRRPPTKLRARRPDNRPVGERAFTLPEGVDPKSLPAIVARNVWALMTISANLKSQLALAKMAGVGQATVDRVLLATPGTRLDNLEKIADAFTREMGGAIPAWLLLVPPATEGAVPPAVSVAQVSQDLMERLHSVSRQVSHDRGATQGPQSSSRVPGSDRKSATKSTKRES